MIELSAADSGSRHTVSVGDELLIRLAENPTTGYRWQFSQSGPGALRLVDDRTEPAGSPSPAPGAAAHRVVRFVADRSGDVELLAVERRSWEADSPARPRVAFHVAIH
jgi:inhibitor of cysteine peptidase